MDPAFEPSGIITLSTDFGGSEPYVGTMKGVILARFPGARVIDMGHGYAPHRPAEAGFWLARSYRFFPPGTVHVAIVDPGVGTLRALLMGLRDGHAFLAPDNGLLAPVVGPPGVADVFRLHAARQGLGLEEPSMTFHGRDIVAPVAAALASGERAPGSLGVKVNDIVRGILPVPEVHAGRVEGLVISVDHFGNLITNIDAGLLAKFEDPIVHVAGRQIGVVSTYGERATGEYLALINAFAVLEIARAERSASEGLGIGRDAQVIVAERER